MPAASNPPASQTAFPAAPGLTPAPKDTRFLALQFPHLATDRLRRERLGRFWRSPAFASERASLAPLALFEEVSGAQRLSALCEAAQALGLSPGLGVAEARARHPGLDLAEADPLADARLLEALADDGDRYTPLVALDPPTGLVFDMSGCAHLFGGERAMMAGMLARLERQGFLARAAIAAAAGTAMALLAGGAAGLCLQAGEARAALGPLSVRALRLEEPGRAMLVRLGLKRVGDLLVLPRAGLARRFGADLLRRLDEALGEAPRPIAPRRPVPQRFAERRFAEPVGLVEDIERIILFLAARLQGSLERQGEGARRLELALFRVDARVERIAVAASLPLRDPARILALFRERLKGSELDPGFGYDLVRLCVTEAEAMADRQETLGAEEAAAGDLETLIDRIGARLGEAAILRLGTAESHWPERAARLHPAGPALPLVRPPAVRPPARPPARGPGPLRPVRLLDVPEPVEASFEVPDGVPLQFRWRRALHVVRRFEGPERIAPEWWRSEAERTRDYFRIEDEAGRRFWLFRRGFSGEAEPRSPQALAVWFLHGIFA